jgi:DNA-binding Lrp family transcriptional regulator
MDNIDRALVALLRDNARTPVLTLAKKLGLPGQLCRTGSPSWKNRA